MYDLFISSLVLHMLDISLVSDITYLMPEEELNEDSYCELPSRLQSLVTEYIRLD